ncbi:FecCD family ABC transporter permease [Cellulomonas sp. CW35]|uniref:ABC transporter permease n=1 Tax=Cellulomonas uda TaxID=1714 RepID=A0A4Y3K944_CELUD|nr:MULTISPECIES: iron ABC transporter permease [Cellulomonas]ASR55200.1 iron ABC transporter permease [Cellulomonas sp. PSBB021]NII65072.1 iron complex transport system permease protein [Cellulomonas uda]GEA81001.1 ABC transporter permease [Cellulomonas uda]
MTLRTTATPADLAPRRPASARPRRATGLAVCVLAVVVAVVCSLAFGSRVVGWSDVVAGVLHPDDTIAQAAVASRVPRTLLGLLVGAALGLAGSVMQGLTRNPLADPALLGVSSGASLFVVLGMAWVGLATLTQYVWAAFLGAALASLLVYAIGSMGREGATPLKLALAGAATSAALLSAVSMVLLTRTDVLDTFRFWQVGSIGRASYAEIGQIVPFLVVGTVLAVGCARGMDAIALGDEVATGLGQRVGLVRGVGALATVLLCGASVAIAGPIGFVGLVVPHLARAFTGPSHRWLLPYAAALGSALLLAADVVGRVVARPQEVEVGIVTAVLGAPVFIAIIRRQKVREL